MKQTILAIGKLRGSEGDWCDDYLKRMRGEVTVREFTASRSLPAAAAQRAEADLLLAALPAKALVILLDERGQDLTSRELAVKIKGWAEQGRDLAFIIGGADGVTDAIKSKAQFMLGLGKLTWPHRLVRVMLLEQLYRAQQINAGHPYHRD